LFLRRLRSVLLVGLTGLRPLDQWGRWGEVLAVLRRELLGTLDEAGQAALVLVDVLEDTTRPRRESDAEDRPDVRIRHRGEHSLIEALDRLDRLGEEHPLLQIVEGLISRTRVVLLADAGPQCGAFAVLVVVVEARLVLAAGAAGFDHPVDDRLGRVGDPRAPGRLGGGL